MADASPGKPLFSYKQVGPTIASHHRRFGVDFIEKKFLIESDGLADFESFVSVERDLENMFDRLLSEMLVSVPYDALIGVELDHDNAVKYENPFFVYGRRDTVTGKRIMDSLLRILQSNSEIQLEGNLMDIKVLIFDRNTVNGRKRKVEMVDDRPGLVTINNTDEYCAYYAITYAYMSRIVVKDARICLSSFSFREVLKNPIDRPGKVGKLKSKCFSHGQLTNFLIKRTRELFIDLIGIDFNGPMQFSFIPLIARSLNVRIFLISTFLSDNKSMKNSSIRDPLVFGESDAPESLFIEITQGDEVLHANVISHLNKYFKTKKFCIRCWEGYNFLHVCYDEEECLMCGSSSCHSLRNKSSEHVNCVACASIFLTRDCFDRHLETRCSSFKTCEECSFRYSTGKGRHVCHAKVCQTCKSVFDNGSHHCSVQPLSMENLRVQDTKYKRFVAFDIETALIDSQHHANMIVSLKICDYCYEKQASIERPTCTLCSGEMNVFEGETCVKDFMNELIHYAKTGEGDVIVFAHNFRGFDGRFIIRDLYERKSLDLSFMMRGTKIMTLKFGNIRFIDTSLLMASPLAQLPKAFGFESIVRKGFFPYALNNSIDCSYQGDFPSRESFGTKNVGEREFEEWYELERLKYAPMTKKKYKLRKHMLRYCVNDVLIAAIALFEFRHTLRSITGIDPITRNFTLAQVAMETFRSKFLTQGGEIGVTPLTGYINPATSRIANAWLETLAIDLVREKIIAVGNSIYYADGYDPRTKTCYEFYGCFFHGCPKCSSSSTDQYLRTKKREDDLKKAGFQIVSIWGCELEEKKRNEPSFAVTLHENLRRQNRLFRCGQFDLKSSLHGGRVENFRLFYKCRENERIRYLDFTSLYPYVLKYRLFPKGHPKLIIDRNYEPYKFFGFVACKILPPRDLVIPLLPIKCNGKLVFTLCAKCAEGKNGNCSHQESERQLIHIWTTVEIDKALEVGYRILETMIIYHFDDRFNEPFKGYVDLFLKIEQEASGFPEKVESETDKDAYIERYQKLEGIKLDKGKIARNPAMRWIAKQLLNSLWGKFAQERDMPRDELVHARERLLKLLRDTSIEIRSLLLINDQTYLVTYKSKNVQDINPGRTSYSFTSFVTSWARLELFNLMEKINSVREDRVLYCDTDSVIFVERDDDPKIPTGDLLGQLTDELANDERCVAGVFLGSKSYTLQISRGDQMRDIIKVKGLTCSANTRHILNFDTLDEYIRSGKVPLQLPQTLFRSKKAIQKIETVTVHKMLRMTTDKRIVMRDMTTVPYGYTKQNAVYGRSDC